MTKAQINRAISHTGLTIHGTRGDLYFYFVDAQGDQVGESVIVARLAHMTIDQWLAEAEAALASEGRRWVYGWIYTKVAKGKYTFRTEGGQTGVVEKAPANYPHGGWTAKLDTAGYEGWDWGQTRDEVVSSVAWLAEAKLAGTEVAA